MRTRIVHRLIGSVAVLLTASALVFVLVDRSTDPLADLRLRQPPVATSTLAAREAALYLDRPTVERWWLWLTGVGDQHGDIGLLRGHWGPSSRGLDVGDEVQQRGSVSLRLLILAVGATSVVGVAAGVLAATRRATVTTRVISGLGYVGLALPTFLLAVALKEGAVALNRVVGRRLLATVGTSSPGVVGVSDRALDLLAHLALPAATIVLGGYFLVARFQRGALRNVLAAPFVRAARARGLSPRRILLRHALRPALPVVATLGGVLASGAVAGTVVVEHVFRWRGLGTLLLDSVTAGDTFVVMAVVVVAAIVVVAANLLADLAVTLLDPRTRQEQGHA